MANTMAEDKKWYVMRVISGQERKIREHLFIGDKSIEYGSYYHQYPCAYRESIYH